MFTDFFMRVISIPIWVYMLLIFALITSVVEDIAQIIQSKHYKQIGGN